MAIEKYASKRLLKELCAIAIRDIGDPVIHAITIRTESDVE